MKELISKIKIYYKGKQGYKNYIGFWINKNNKLCFTTKGLSFYKN